MITRILILIAILLQSGCAAPTMSRNASARKLEDIPLADVHLFVEPLPGPFQVTK